MSIPRPSHFAGVLGSLLGLFAISTAHATGRVEFNRDIRPVLSDNCFACHGPDTAKMKGGLRLDLRDAALAPAKSGKPAIIVGKPEESELVRRLQTTDPDDLMPPPESHKTLTSAQRELLIRWISEGAEYQGHWAYQPPRRPAAPSGPAAIDHLVRSRLGKIGITPAPEADRRTLVRRLHFDLVGLPPSPEDVAAFERDTRSGAYERLVERLLSSPHHGERMAIAWLDVVRFADTIGYHSDNPRNIWPYRDYVIQSFNRNKPFDVFTREQIAGDLIPGAGLEQQVASAFNRLLLTTEEGGAQPKDYEARYLTDRVRAIGTVWMGQTIGCAQCHDHKFDPISTRDFYAMGAFFADVKETIIGRREDGILVPQPGQAAELRRRQEVFRSLEASLNGPHPELQSEYEAWQRQQSDALRAEERWTVLTPASAESAEGATLRIRDDRSILASGKNPDLDTYRIVLTNTPARLAALRLEALPHDSLPSKGPGRAGNGNFVLTEFVARLERPGMAPVPLPIRFARATHEQTSHAENNPYHGWTASAVIDSDAKGVHAGWAILPQVGQTHQLLLELASPVTVEAGATLQVELQQKHGHGSHTLGRFRLSASADPAAVRSPGALPPPPGIAELIRIPASERKPAQNDQLYAEFRKQTPALAGLRSLVDDARKGLEQFEAGVPRCLVTERGEPRVVRILPRGNWMNESGEILQPALPVVLSSGYAAPRRALNRLDLADWIVSPDNPLMARTVMNRLWKQFFGMGLSKVLDDLGAQGEPPVNQALLDWLAVEFRDSGWDMRHMVRTIVLSQTYRQSSVASRQELTRDPENRDLARQSRWRLDAELVRDNALSIAGLLVPKIGGPSARPYQPDGYWENLNFPQRGYDASTGQDQYRRGLYTWWQRSYTHPSMLAFDAPTREECAADRGRSNIPQQALVLLNDPTYVEAARSFAARILTQGPRNPRDRIVWAWRQALARPATEQEIATLSRLLEKQFQEYTADTASARSYLGFGQWKSPENLDPAELAAWTDIARAILNLHETITRS